MKRLFVPQKVNKHTRASKYQGREIECPKCGQTQTVYHFAWSAIGCQRCKEMVDKYDWMLV